MPGRVTLTGSARDAFMRESRNEPKMGGVLEPRHVPRGIGQGKATHKRGEFRRSVKPAKSAGRHVRHCEVRVLFRNGDGPIKWVSNGQVGKAAGAKVGGNGNAPRGTRIATWYGNMKRYAGTYLTRDGGGIDGGKPEFFSVDKGGQIIKADGLEFVEQAKNDRTIIEIIIPPNDGEKIKDMQGFTAAFMAKVEDDLETKLTWVAVVHEKHDVAHPKEGPTKNKHSHVLMRGVDEHENFLWISREYLSSTLRDVAQKELTAYPTNEREKGWRLGRMSEQEVAAFQKQMADNRPARIKRGLTVPTEQERQQMHEREHQRTPPNEADKDKQRKRDRSRGMEE